MARKHYFAPREKCTRAAHIYRAFEIGLQLGRTWYSRRSPNSFLWAPYRVSWVSGV